MMRKHIGKMPRIALRVKNMNVGGPVGTGTFNAAPAWGGGSGQLIQMPQVNFGFGEEQANFAPPKGPDGQYWTPAKRSGGANPWMPTVSFDGMPPLQMPGGGPTVPPGINRQLDTTLGEDLVTNPYPTAPSPNPNFTPDVQPTIPTTDVSLDVDALKDAGLDPGYAEQLKNYSDFVADPGNIPAWYGTKYNPETGTFDQVNNQGMTQADWVAAGGAPEDFQPLNPVADFSQAQLEGQKSAIDSAQLGHQLAQLGYGELAQQITGSDAYTQKLAQEAANKVAGSFGASGTLGSARNVQTAATAAADVIQKRKQSAIDKISGIQENLQAHSQVLREVGGDQQKLAQLMANNDVRAWNYFQTLPQEQQTELLAIMQQAQAAQDKVHIPTGQPGGAGSGPSGIEKAVQNIGNVVNQAGNVADTIKKLIG